MNREQKRMYKRKYNSTQRAVNKALVDNSREIVREAAKKELNQAREEAFNDAMNQAMLLTLVLPAKVLMDIYWPKSYKEKIPEFIKHVLEYYERWQNDEYDIDELKRELWEIGGVKIIEEGNDGGA